MAVNPLVGEDSPILRDKWPLVFVATLVVAVAAYGVYASYTEPRGGSVPGMTFGIIAFLLMLFLMAYKIRKHLYHYKLGPTSSWLSAHIYLGVLAAIFALMHVGASPGGTFGTFLYVALLLVTASGVVGALIFKAIPISLAKESREMIPKDHIEQMLKKLLDEADKDAKGMSKEFQALYRAKLRPMLTHKRVTWEYLFTEERQLTRKRQAQMEEMRREVPDGEKFHFSLLTSLLMEKERLAFRVAKMESLDKWLALHMPLSGITLTAVFIHIFVVLYY